MKVFFHPDFYQVYTSDPAADPGRMEAIVQAIESEVTFITPQPANETDIKLVHPREHIDWVKKQGLYDIAALAAGAAIETAIAGLDEPSFGLIRPPGHHASANSCWGFCYFNNMAVALLRLKEKGSINRAMILDFDLHFGDGNVNILGDKPWVAILNPEASDADDYVALVERTLANASFDIIGVSAGFDNHREDWGGLLATEDYEAMGRMVRQAAECNQAGCFGILEGGYNHAVLGRNVRAFLRGMGNEAD